jgi:CBS domain-containing protein
MRLELVKDWMSSDVITVEAKTGLLEADRMMRENGIRRLPVVENGRLVGIVTYGDVREARPSAATSLSTWEMNYLLSRLEVREVMTANPITIKPDAIVGEAASLMLNNRISGLPVVTAQGEIAGVITESDIFRMVAHEWESAQDEESSKPYAHYQD